MSETTIARAHMDHVHLGRFIDLLIRDRYLALRQDGGTNNNRFLGVHVLTPSPVSRIPHFYLWFDDEGVGRKHIF